MKIAYISFIVLYFSSCNTTSESRKLQLNDSTYAVGNISKDSIYNGEIKFYNKKDDKLIAKCNYIKSMENGEYFSYYSNGVIACKANFEQGKINGRVDFFNIDGMLTNQQSYYYDFKVGPDIYWEKGKVKSYSFISLDHKELVRIDYDSLNINKKITDLQTNYFFYHFLDLALMEKSVEKLKLFSYLPNPPKYNFKYSLVKITKDYKIIQVLKEFNSSFFWDTVEMEIPNFSDSTAYALRLVINDSIAKGTFTMYKKLP